MKGKYPFMSGAHHERTKDQDTVLALRWEWPHTCCRKNAHLETEMAYNIKEMTMKHWKDVREPQGERTASSLIERWH